MPEDDETKKHLELFIFRVAEMRKAQQEYFAGNRHMLGTAKQKEFLVDKAINKLLSDYGYTITELQKKIEPNKLF